MLRRSLSLAARTSVRLGGVSRAQLHMWLRDETKPFEHRAPLTPEQAAELMASGVELSVERSDTRIFPDSAYEDVGCTMVDQYSWYDAPDDAIIFGLKELPDEDVPLKHRHIYFAHCYKGQTGDEKLLERFKVGGGTIYDLEFLHTPGTDMRVAAFGHMTGYCGAAVGTFAWVQQQLDASTPLGVLNPYPNEDALKDALKGLIEQAGGQLPSAHIIGALGRCGGGAVRFFEEMGISDVGKWDFEETKAGGPFPEAFQRDIFLNTVYLRGKVPPFVTKAMVADDNVMKTSVVVDVSCDYTSKDNPVPIYHDSTKFDKPTIRVFGPEDGSSRVLDVVAIDHLPTLLPLESSVRYANDLFPYIKAFDKTDDPNYETWHKAEKLFHAKTAEVLGTPL